ncbi:hypothetical protein MKX01_006780, partial [Papaver californicum]
RGGISEQREWKLFDSEEIELEEKNKISSDAFSRRCDSKSRGSIYNPVLGFLATFAGICASSLSFFEQRKLCGEEDCKHCGDLDNDHPCSSLK